MIYQASTLQLPFSPDFMRVFHRAIAGNPPFITVFDVWPTPQSIVEEASPSTESTTYCVFRRMNAGPIARFGFPSSSLGNHLRSLLGARTRHADVIITRRR